MAGCFVAGCAQEDGRRCMNLFFLVFEKQPALHVNKLTQVSLWFKCISCMMWASPQCFVNWFRRLFHCDKLKLNISEQKMHFIRLVMYVTTLHQSDIK